MNEEYKSKIEELMRKHRLGFLHNPGGGEFTHDLPNLRRPCQVPFMGDYREDYECLMQHLVDAGMEPPAACKLVYSVCQRCGHRLGWVENFAVAPDDDDLPDSMTGTARLYTGERCDYCGDRPRGHFVPNEKCGGAPR